MGFFGFLLVIAGVVCWVLARKAAKTQLALASTETLTVRDIEALSAATEQAAGPGLLRTMCEVQGTVREGPDGPLSSPLAGVECVWYANVVLRKTRAQDGTSVRISLGLDSTSTSTQPFYVEDETGRILLLAFTESGTTAIGKPRIHGMPDAVDQVMERTEPGDAANGGTGTVESRYYEWVLRPGRQVFALGEVTDSSGELVLGPPRDGGPYLLSRQPQDVVMEDQRKSQTKLTFAAYFTGVSGVLLMFLGLVT
jgi:E3 Ubiquitin ligase